ncbi:hypothetical protein [Vibrio ichthyoenteri]|uniref:hypothetical protein n=1 Tax=Vibrio ichthyoenteri TaxID=142461 RepID=UPI0011108B78|nr:hypothetical protein [Vibrio ichthyoenteri]
MSVLNYQHAYLEIRKLMALQLNVLIGNWLDEPENKTSPYQSRMDEALALSCRLCDQPIEDTPELHEQTIDELISCINTLVEVTEGTDAYLHLIPYSTIYSDILRFGDEHDNI